MIIQGMQKKKERKASGKHRMQRPFLTSVLYRYMPNQHSPFMMTKIANILIFIYLIYETCIKCIWLTPQMLIMTGLGQAEESQELHLNLNLLHE